MKTTLHIGDGFLEQEPEMTFNCNSIPPINSHINIQKQSYYNSKDEHCPDDLFDKIIKEINPKGKQITDTDGNNNPINIGFYIDNITYDFTKNGLTCHLWTTIIEE